MITPTVGRVVHYRSDGPLGPTEAAIIVGVNDDTNVNLTVFTMYGTTMALCAVHLKQEIDESPPAPYCEWMPFQRGQADKADTKGGLMDRVAALEALVAKLSGG